MAEEGAAAMTEACDGRPMAYVGGPLVMSGVNLGTIAQVDATGRVTFDWPAIELAAKDPTNTFNFGIARILLAARDAGRQAVAPHGFE